ncbi:MAG: SpoIIE family protein phosphatase [Actinomycetota bacterium]|nr:SpoIIE family protein phosphatase [Actinomycetota bacterium]
MAAGRPDLCDDVALVAGELVTNALLHGGGCRSVDVVVVDDGLRIEVRDNNHLRPVVGYASEASLTGRGMYLVTRLSARWAAESEPEGKLVWAEVTGEVPPLEDVDADELLARWDDDWPAEEEGRSYHLELGDVPTELLLAAKSHVDNVVREFALASAGATAGVTATVPPHLVALVDAVDRFAQARLAIKYQALDSARRNAEITRLSLDLPLSAADAAEEYLAALDEIDAYCRASRLLTLETPPQHRVFRQWYIGELVTQLRAAAEGRPAPPTQSFERRLLAELDRMAAAQRASDRAARLYAVASALASADTPETVTQAVLKEGVAALGAMGGGVLLSTDADRLALSGAVGYDEPVLAHLRDERRDAELPAAAALRSGEAIWLESRAERDSRFPDLVDLEATTVALCAVPLEVQGRCLGALRFSFTEPRLFDEDERRFVLALAAQTAQALERTQLQHARIDVSRRLQRSLLPPSLPDVPGLDIAAIYHPFGDGVDIGGDFYDAWQLGPDRWAIAIGDVAGTGPEAAALTALVRHTLRALTMTDADPERVIARLNRALRDSVTDAERFCTAVFGLISTDGPVQAVLASGGHPPLFVRRANGEVVHRHVGGSLLGVLGEPEIGVVQMTLGPGDTLLLVTDGVLEARIGKGPWFDAEGVARVLSADQPSAKATASAVESAVLEHTTGRLSDDVAAIVLRVDPQPG